MTREPAGLCHSGHPDADLDLLALLWEEAPFPRLPRDAPPELKEFVQNIENPRHVYTVHRAARRHNFQALVEKFVVQLRYGCDSPSCITPSCLSCRKRTAGKAPIRRYNPTSARTLAVYLASQDNPDRALCPFVRVGKDTPAAIVNALVISPVHSVHNHHSDSAFAASNGHATAGKGKGKGAKLSDSRGRSPRNRSPTSPTSPRTREFDVRERNGSRGRSPAGSPSARPAIRRQSTTAFELKEQPTRQDHRSFAANMFGTVAFKMMEWLTPHGLEALTKKAHDLSTPSDSNNPPVSPSIRPASPSPNPVGTAAKPSHTTGGDDVKPNESGPPSETTTAPPKPTSSSTKTPNPRRNSNAKVRAAATKPIRKVSTDPFVPNPTGDDAAPTLVSPRIGGIHPEKLPRPPKSTASREVSFVPPSPSGSSDDAEVERASPEQETVLKLKLVPAIPTARLEEVEESRTMTDGDGREDQRLPGSSQDTASSESTEDPDLEECDNSSADTALTLLGNAILPQSLSHLNFEIVEFLFNVLREDSTFESPLRIPRGRSWKLQAPRLKRLPGMPNPYPVPLKMEWKRFIEQSVFYIMSDPRALVRSFTTADGKLMDSASLWRCMVRLTDAAPTLVFHSLWIAAASLFTLPKSLQPTQSPSTKSFPKTDRSLSNTEAGYLLSICLHALVAAAPEIPNRAALFDISRLRSSGAVLTGGGGPRLPSNLCLEYDDLFSDSLAIRLAKRLFSALVARKHFASLAEYDDCVLEKAEDMNVLAPLFDQLDVLISNTDGGQNPAHLAQAVPLLLIDWARAVLMSDWDGQPVFNPDSAFGGALLFIETMYDRRQELLLPDVNFRVEYLADRLDSACMPVDWLTFVPTPKKQHLLDRPFVFHPSTLVSYFRAVNLSRMSRSYEEPSSVYERVRRFVSDGLLDHNHRRVLQDMLRRATSKYLVLNVGRKTVVRDTFDQLWQREERELLRPLKLHLGEDNGEEGFDLGGVQQEFFKLAFAEIFNPGYGAFTVDERTRMAWFVPGSLLETWKFELVGVLFSLAVYNGITLPVTLPRALYRKLLGQEVGELHHIEDGWPELASGLTTLLEWDERDGSVEDIFARTYEFSVEAFDVPVSRDMTSLAPSKGWPRAAAPPGSDAPAPAAGNPEDAPMVTHENRGAYVSDYIRFLTDVSVRPQYEAFERGFRACLHPRALEMLSPAILQSVVEGTQEIDVAELRRHTRYNGWDASHRTIRDFWSVVQRYDDDMKRRLLEFVTASDRVPVGGMQNLQFVVQRNGEEGKGGRLPTAYTCYGTLLLPEYSSREVLKERLGMALENAQGFGFG